MERLDWSQGEPKDDREWIQRDLVIESILPPCVAIGWLSGQPCHISVMARRHIFVMI